ncbi:HAMP domain-containing protein [Heliorestis convoluta]
MQEIQGLLFVVAIGLLALFLNYSIGFITRPLSDLSLAMERFGKDQTAGEIDEVNQYVSRQDEIGNMAQVLLTMQKRLEQATKKVNIAAEELASSAEEMTAMSQQIAVASDQSSQTIEQIANSIHEQANDTEKGAQIMMQFGKIIEQELKLVERLSRFANNMMRIKDQGEEAFHELVKKAEESNQSALQVYKVIEGNNANDTKNLRCQPNDS